MNQSVATISSRPTFHADVVGQLETISPEFLFARRSASILCGARRTRVDALVMRAESDC
jgi:hypothetical protein